MKRGVIIALVVGGIFIATIIGVMVYYKTRKTNFVNDILSGKKRFNIDDAKAGLKVVLTNYGADMARKVEQLARLETGNFTSTQYQMTGTGGMEAVTGSSAPYYGWYTSWWLAHPTYTPIGTINMKDAGNPRDFIIMPSVEAWMMFLANYATVYANQGGIYRWNSTVPAQQQVYAAAVNRQSTSLTDQLTAA